MTELLRKPIDQITFADVREFCAEQVRENKRLEYKRNFSSDRPGKQIAKEVAAFANTDGGLILWGVDEIADRTPEPDPQGCPLGGNPRSTVLNACVDNIFPPVVPDVSEFIKNPDDDSKGFLVVRVAASDELHATEYGSGIYIRTADRSGPVRPDLPMIEHLLARRRAQVDLQTRRRNASIEHISYARGGKAGPGVTWISIGPRLVTAPLFELTPLKEQAHELSVQSVYYSGMRSPIDRLGQRPGVLDGVYDSDRFDHAGLIDVYGNMTMMADLARTGLFEERWLDDDEKERAPTNDKGEYLAIEAILLIERIIAAFRSAALVHRVAGFVGLLSGQVMVKSVRNLPLIASETGRAFGARVLGTCPTADTISLDFTFATSELDTDESMWCALYPIVLRLLWAWGHTEEADCPGLINLAEFKHFGDTTSGGCGHYRPRNRERCFKCRDSADGDTTK